MDINSLNFERIKHPFEKIHPNLTNEGQIEVTDRFWSVVKGIMYEVTEFTIDGTQNFIVKVKKKK